MKKLGLFALAMALVMTLSQCKKDDTTTPANDGKKVTITLNVGDNGSRHSVTPSTGAVTFQLDDKLHVVSNGTYLGTLNYYGNFSGTINEPTEGQPLHFYFLGNLQPTFNSDNTGFSVVISDQTTNLPVISYNTSKENYESGKTDYNARLMNHCALVKFDVNSADPNFATCIMGMNNRVTMTFADNTFSYDQVDNGVVRLSAGNGEQWAILLPQDEVTAAVARTASDTYEGTCGTIPAIHENDYLTDGISVTMTTPALPQGVVGGTFSVSDVKQVYFSKGNLQYIGSAATPYWKFADHQWDFLGDNGQVGGEETIDRDLFGYGTSGCNGYQPYSTSTYSWSYPNGNLMGTSDWGYNAIVNGGNQTGKWRTLSNAEWRYIFLYRTNASSKYGFGVVQNVNNGNDVKGVILLPDEWTSPGLSFTPGNTNWANVYTADEWAQMEAAGAVFLPAAGERYDVNYWSNFGRYWSSTLRTGSSAYVLYFDGSYPEDPASTEFSHGCSVRLVLD